MAKHRYLLRTLILIVVVALLAAACSGDETETTTTETGAAVTTAPAAGGDDIKIAFLQRTLGAPYYVAMTAEMGNKALEHGVEIISLTAELDAATYASQVEDVISQGVDGVVINSIDPGTMIDIDQQFVDAGIPVVYIDTPVLEIDSIAIVQSDNLEIGRGAGLAMANRLTADGRTEINLAHLHGDPTDIKVGPERYQGFLNGLDEGGITVNEIADGVGNYNSADGLTVSEDLLVAFPEIDVFFGNNDAMALGALAAVEGAGRDDILVAGIDGQKEGLQKIAEGGCTGQYVSSGTNSPSLAASQGIDILISVISGETVDADWADVTFTPAFGVDCNNIDDFYDPNSVF